MAPPEPRAALTAPAEAFFLEAGSGSRFCLYHAPLGECRGALVYIHPFAEEMNRSRRMAALAARALAAQGIGVLQVDLYGCGDSSGDFGDARWDTWKSDVWLARDWIKARLGCPVGLWGLRLGALLALDSARDKPVNRLLLWHPVTNGAGYLTQQLRLRLAADLVQDEGAKVSTAALRDQLRAGASLEIAGYTLAPELALSIDSLDAAALAPVGYPVHWFEMIAAPGRTLAHAASRIESGWRSAGADVCVELVCGQQFWSTPEIVECPALAEATVKAMCEAAHV
jgi:exosortase A-associated hydrolase 2